MKGSVRCWHILVLAGILLGCSEAENKQTETVSAEDLNPEQPALVKPQLENVEGPNEVVNREHYHTVEIKQMKFIPAELTIKRGDTVVWVNNGITKHDVTEQQSGAWSSKELPVGSSWMFIPEKSADYYCSIHVVMTGKLVVKE